MMFLALHKPNSNNLGHKKAVDWSSKILPSLLWQYDEINLSQANVT